MNSIKISWYCKFVMKDSSMVQSHVYANMFFVIDLWWKTIHCLDKEYKWRIKVLDFRTYEDKLVFKCPTHFLYIVVPFQVWGTWVSNIYFIFKIHFNNKNNNLWKLAINIGSFFGRFSRLWTYNRMRYFITFSHASLKKWGDPPYSRMEKCCQLLDTWSGMVDWPEARSS
jgi:hypothetical protein